MKKALEILKILFICIIGFAILITTSNYHSNENKEDPTIDEDTVYKLHEEVESLTEENDELSNEKEDLMLDLKNANERIEELQELLEQNGIHESSDIVLTDGPSQNEIKK